MTKQTTKADRKIWITGSMHSGTTITTTIIKELMGVVYNGGEHPVAHIPNTMLLDGITWMADSFDLTQICLSEEIHKRMRICLEEGPSVLKAPEWTVTWPVWEGLGIVPHHWVVCLRSPEILVHTYAVPGSIPGRRRAVAQHIDLLFQLANESKVPVTVISFPEVLMRMDYFVEKLVTITGKPAKLCAESVKRHAKLERYRIRDWKGVV